MAKYMARNTLTLNFKKKKEENSDEISSSGKELLAERQRLLKEAQYQKIAAQKAQIQEKIKKKMEAARLSFQKNTSTPGAAMGYGGRNGQGAGQFGASAGSRDGISSNANSTGVSSDAREIKSANRSGRYAVYGTSIFDSTGSSNGGTAGESGYSTFRNDGDYSRGLSGYRTEGFGKNRYSGLRNSLNKRNASAADRNTKRTMDASTAENKNSDLDANGQNGRNQNLSATRGNGAGGYAENGGQNRELLAAAANQTKYGVGDRKSSYRDGDRDRFSRKGFSEDESMEKTDKKTLKSRDDKYYNKYSKNIHTYIFNEDGDDDEEIYGGNRSIRRRRRIKNILGTNNHPQQKIFQTVNIPDFISVADLADRMSEKKSDIIKKLMTMGLRVTANQVIDADTAELVVVEFGHTPNRVSDADIENVLKENQGTNFVPRSPVVTVMGHVDHGKTSLLDALRTTRVAEGESGGITQHIGASRVEVSKGKFITFIDTPGHEAFTEMRMRGANITDLVVLVVAADDGVKDQTIEAINHTRAAGVPMMVAINKIDRPGADPERVKQELLQYDVIAEEYGGNVMFVNVSAKNKTNMDKLLEGILLQAEILDLKAPIDCNASGAVIESRIDSQKGVIATVLVQKGVLKIGDVVVAGTSYGKVKKMVDDHRKSQEEATPSMAVEILGLDNPPSAGVPFNVVDQEKEARDIVSYRENKERESKEARRAGRSIESVLQQVKGSNKKQLSLVIKADVSGSIEAIVGSLKKLNNEEVVVDIIHSATGGVTESDINLVSASSGIIVAFNVRATGKVKDMAKEKGVEIKYYSIIYDVVDEIKALMSGLLKPVLREKTLGQAEIRNVIKIPNVGKVAGCYVTDGEIRRNADARLIRDGVVIFDSKIKTLRRFKEDVKEVKNNYECGITLENYDDIKEGDIIECYEKIEEKRVV